MAITRPHKLSRMDASERDGEAGFTLIEVMCVVALLGLTAGLVVVNLPQPAPKFRTEVQSVTTVLNVAARQSIIDGKTRGFEITAGQLDVLKYDGEWNPDHQSLFTDISDLNLTVENQEIDLRVREKNKKKSELPPLIHFDATGNVTPFILSMSGQDESFTIEPDERGRIVMKEAQ